MQTQSQKPEDSNVSQTPSENPREDLRENQDKKLDRMADDAATQGSKTQQRYDKDHNIFTK